MNNNVRKNRWRRAEAAKKREERVITGYVQMKHPEIYKEAAGFYNLLNEKYPSKLDLRKTNEYEALRMPVSGETIKKYYTRKAYPNIKKSVDVEVHNPGKTYEGNMQLNIQLISAEPVNKPVNEEPTTELQNTETVGVNEEQTTELQNTETVGVNEEPTANQDPLIQPAEIIIGETGTLEATFNAEIPEGVIEEIMATLQEDPFLESCFMDIDIDESSPLEKELALW